MRREKRRSRPLRRATEAGDQGLVAGRDPGDDDRGRQGSPGRWPRRSRRRRPRSRWRRPRRARRSPRAGSRARRRPSTSAAIAPRPGRGRDPVRQPVRGDDRRRARGAGKLDQQQPDRPAAEHADGVAGPDAGEAQRVDGDAQRLQHRARRVVDRVRQGDEVGLRPGDAARASPRPWSSGRGTGPSGTGDRGPAAQVSHAPHGTCGSIATRCPARGPSAITPGGLVAEDERAREDGVADPGLVVPVQVGAADADRGHPDQCLARPRDRGGLVGEPEVAGAVEAERPHRRRLRAGGVGRHGEQRLLRRPRPASLVERRGDRREPCRRAPRGGPCPARGAAGRRRSCRPMSVPRRPPARRRTPSMPATASTEMLVSRSPRSSLWSTACMSGISEPLVPNR